MFFLIVVILDVGYIVVVVVVGYLVNDFFYIC